MTQRDHEVERRDNVAVYDDRGTTPTRTYDREPAFDRDVSMQVRTPADRVRWGPIIAGLFTALTTGILLSLAALAFGLNQFNPNSTLESFGIGAGIVGALLWLIAFGVGGYVAARTAAFPGRSNGVFNGLMVALVGIPLLLWSLTGLVGGLLGTAGSIAGTAAQTAGAAAPAAEGELPAAGEVQDEAQDAAQQAQQTAEQLAQQAQQNQEQIADAARNVALGSLVPFILALAAAATGGAIGARKPEEDHIHTTA